MFEHIIIKTVKYTLITLWHSLYALLCHARTCLYSETVMCAPTLLFLLHTPHSIQRPLSCVDRTTVYSLFYPLCLSLLRLISGMGGRGWRGGLFPPSLIATLSSVCLLLHVWNNGWHPPRPPPPSAAICYVESPRDTFAYLSSAAQTSKSALASRRDGEAPPGSRRRLQSARCSPGIKYPFR